MKKVQLLLFTVLFSIQVFSKTYNVLDYGAIGDGITTETAAIQKAINTCDENGGGTIYIPAGKNFVIGTIYLKSNITLLIGENASILGSTDMKDYTDDTGTCPYYPEPLNKCLIFAKNASNITITGQGTINGRFVGDLFKQVEQQGEVEESVQGSSNEERPMLVRFHRCENIKISNIRMKNSASWCNHLLLCKNVRLLNLTIHNDRQDGFNIESCQNVMIANCDLICGDDGIALTSNPADDPMKNLTVTNCNISSRWAAIRLGPLSQGNFENITVSNCVFYDCYGGGLKIGMFEGAEIKNCIFSDIIMDNVSNPIGLFLVRYKSIPERKPLEEKTLQPVGKISNLHFRNMVIKAMDTPDHSWNNQPSDGFTPTEGYDTRIHPNWASTIFVHGHPESDIENVSFENIQISFPGGGTVEEGERRGIMDMDKMGTEGVWTEHKEWGIMPSYGLYARHVNGLELNNVRFEYRKEEGRSPVFINESRNVELKDFKAEVSSIAQSCVILKNSQDCSFFDNTPLNETNIFLRLEGEQNKNILLNRNRLDKVEHAIKVVEGACKKAVKIQ